jgi:hypothetical protein
MDTEREDDCQMRGSSTTLRPGREPPRLRTFPCILGAEVQGAPVVIGHSAPACSRARSSRRDVVAVGPDVRTESGETEQTVHDECRQDDRHEHECGNPQGEGPAVGLAIDRDEGRTIRLAKMKAITPAKEIPPDQSTAANGTCRSSTQSSGRRSPGRR